MGKQQGTGLELLRGQIDAADTALLKALVKRISTVDAIAALKQADGAGFGYRPAREAALMRRVLAAAPKSLDPQLIRRSWRMLIGEALVRQGLNAVLVASGDEALARWDLARACFGMAAPLKLMESARETLDRVLEEDGTIAFLPWVGGGGGPWWASLYESRMAAVRIVSTYPFFEGETRPQAAIVARAVPEPSGLDDTLIVAHDDRSRAEAILEKAGLEAVISARAHTLVLIRLRGWFDDADPRLLDLRDAGLDGLKRVGTVPRIS
jgi:chorismate mutase